MSDRDQLLALIHAAGRLAGYVQGTYDADPDDEIPETLAELLADVHAALAPYLWPDAP